MMGGGGGRFRPMMMPPGGPPQGGPSGFYMPPNHDPFGGASPPGYAGPGVMHPRTPAMPPAVGPSPMPMQHQTGGDGDKKTIPNWLQQIIDERGGIDKIAQPQKSTEPEAAETPVQEDPPPEGALLT
eukprot:Trichotokara_eunicae@DN9201_c0_g1_i1.p1